MSVEQNQNHFNFICRTQEMLGAKELYPVKADAFKYLQSLGQRFDFIFADPPYELPGIDSLPAIIFEKKLLKPGGLFVLEHSKKNSIFHFYLILVKRGCTAMYIFHFFYILILQ